MVQKIIKDQDLLDNQISQALLKIKIKEYNKAKIILEKLQKLNQPDFRIYINLANIYIIQNNINKSLEILNTYLQNFKFEKNIANHLGKLCLNYNLNEQLEQLFDTSKLYLKEEDENKYYLYFLQGKYFEKKGNLEDAISSYILSINSKKEFKNSYIELLNILEKTNNLKLFNHYVNLSLKQFHNDKNNLIFFFYKSLLLNRQNKYEESYALILENKLINNLNENKFNIRLFDLMSKNLDKLGQYKMSFDYIQNRNSLIKNLNENRKYNKNVILNTIQNYKKFFTNKYFNQVNQKLKYDDDSNLVFLVGFPRSGTTLLDTILRTHSRISVLEEQPYLLNIRHSYFKSKNNNLKSLLQITQKEKDQIRTSYLKNFKSEIDSGKIIIDKLPSFNNRNRIHKIYFSKKIKNYFSFKTSI